MDSTIIDYQMLTFMLGMACGFLFSLILKAKKR